MRQKGMGLTGAPISHAQPPPNHSSSRSQRTKEKASSLKAKVMRATLSDSSCRDEGAGKELRCFTDLLIHIPNSLERKACDDCF